MSTDLAKNGRIVNLDEPRAEIQRRYAMQDIEVMAKQAAASRMFGMDAAQAFTLMLIAQSEGLDPIQALKRYHVIQGRPAMRADAMQAEFQRQGGTVQWLKTTDAECMAIFRHPVQCPGGQHVGFTMADAKRAELGAKDNWRKYPAAMLRARVISMGVRMVLPGVVVGIYTPEEVSDFTDDDRGPVRTVILERPADDSGPPFVHEPTHEPRAADVSEARAFIRDELVAAHDRLRATLAIERKPELFQPIAKEPQVAQALVSQWIDEGALDEKEVLKDRPNAKGELVRDPAKVGAAVSVSWSTDEEATREDIREYLRRKEREFLRSAGIEVGDEAQATADDD